MKLREFFLISILLIFSLTQTGCASFNRKLKNFLNGRGLSAETTVVKNTSPKFSESTDLAPRVRRQYKRMTRETLAQEASLDSKAGSLWVMEGQGAYLFSQNIVRLVGDPIAVQIDGDPKDQLNSKVNVIKKLLAKIEEKQRLRLRQPSAAGEEKEPAKDSSKKKGEKDKADKNDKSQDTETAQKDSADGGDMNVKVVPTRIVERLPDGNYRVKGSQPFMVGSREYKVIVTGIVRAEEFNDEGISATKLLDPKFDIVSARRKEGEM